MNNLEKRAKEFSRLLKSYDDDIHLNRLKINNIQKILSEGVGTLQERKSMWASIRVLTKIIHDLTAQRERFREGIKKALTT